MLGFFYNAIIWQEENWKIKTSGRSVKLPAEKVIQLRFRLTLFAGGAGKTDKRFF